MTGTTTLPHTLEQLSTGLFKPVNLGKHNDVIHPQLCTHLWKHSDVLFHRSTHRWGKPSAEATRFSTAVDTARCAGLSTAVRRCR